MTMQEQPASRIAITPIDSNASVLDHALSYGRDGFRVVFVYAPIFGKDREPSEEFPHATNCTCGSGGDCSIGKHPIGTNWEKNSTSLESKLRDQYQRHKKPNVGIQLGPQPNGSYVIAIDVDEEERFRELVIELGELPVTARCDSGRGYRLFYIIPDEVPATTLHSVTGIGGKPGVDAKAKKGQVVVAPSWHKNGKQYVWSQNGPLNVLPLQWALQLVQREAPDWIHDFTPQSMREDEKLKRKAERYLEKAVREDSVMLSMCKQGLRNPTLYNRAVSLFSLCAGMYLGHRWSYVHGELSRAAHAAGLPQQEVRKTVESAEKWVRASGAVRIPVVLADPSSGPNVGNVLPDSSPVSQQPSQPQQLQQRPTIRLTPEIFTHADESVEALRSEDNLYQRNGYLVHVTKVTHEESDRSVSTIDDSGTVRRALVLGSPQIRQLTIATLREKMTRVAVFQKFDSKISAWKHVEPTDHVVSAVHDRGQWASIRPIIGITETPTMRVDGSIVQEPGYDLSTRYLYEPSTKFGIVQASPSQEDARAAYASLVELFEDFPYLNDAHKAVPVAAILTLIARPAIAGAVPGFLFDASTRGSGKTLQTDAVAIVATGRGAPRMNFPSNEDEMEKVLGAYALRGAPFFSLDNVPSNRPFGGGPLDRVLTARDAVDLRVLGRSEVPTLEWRAMIMATGNNIQIYADTARRVLVARLEPKDEHPEKRTNFKHEDLLGWIRKERPRLVVAALTLLRAWVVAGRPKMRCARWGSFEEWSAFIPHAIMFAGGADPMLARPASDADVDSETRAFSYILSQLHTTGLAEFKVSALLQVLYRPRSKEEIEIGTSDPLADLKDSVETLCPPKFGKPPDAVALGNRLRAFKGRYIDGRRLVSRTGSGGTVLWKVESSSDKQSNTYENQELG